MANQPEKLTCITCHGTFFNKLQAEQFVAGGYGSAEFRSLSNAPKMVLICIGCGTPVTPKPSYYGKNTTSGVVEEEFAKSIEYGQKYRKENSIQNVANIAVSPSELNEVRILVGDIKKAVEAQAKPKAPRPKQVVARTG